MGRLHRIGIVTQRIMRVGFVGETPQSPRLETQKARRRLLLNSTRINPFHLLFNSCPPRHTSTCGSKAYGVRFLATRTPLTSWAPGVGLLADDLSWQDQRLKELRDTIELWANILRSWDVTGTPLMEFQACIDHEDACSILHDFLKGKAPSTLRKRARSIMQLAEWVEKQGFGLPCSESIIYSFLRSLRVDGASSSKMQAILEAVRFCHFVLGITGFADTCTSRRCRGVCMADKIRPVGQASPLSVKELEVLHKYLADGEDPWDAVAAGTILLAVYSRARWADLMHTEAWVIDVDESGSPAYLECRVQVHKTISSANNRFRMLPLVAPAFGVTNDNWVEQYLRARRRVGLKPPPANCLLPAPNGDGAPCVRPVETGEITLWLRGLLQTPADSERRISSHSMKATCLSFAAKWGLPVQDRLILGYHSTHCRMAITYARDVSAPQMRMLEEILDAIRGGHFAPDLPRSMRRTSMTADVNKAIGVSGSLPVKIEMVDSESEPGSRGEEPATESDSSAPSEDHPAALYLEERPPESQGRYTSWQHSKSRVWHLMYSHNKKVFLCGRCVGAFHKQEEGRLPLGASRCRMCFKVAKDTAQTPTTD